LKTDDFGSVHEKALEALGQIGDPKVVPVLLNYLQAESENQQGYSSIAAAAVKGLARTGDPRAAEPLYKAITTDPFLRGEAVELLLTYGGADGVKYLNRLAKSEDGFFKHEASEALETLGEYHGLDPLVELLKDSDPQVQSQAAAALTETGDATVTSALEEAMAGLDEQDRQSIERSLSQNTVASEGNASAMQSAVKITAIEALGQIKDSRAVRPLLTALHDEDADTRKAAGKALAAYQSKALLRPMELSLKSGDKGTMKQALDDLGWIGTDDAVQLIGMRVTDPLVGWEAIDALGHSDNPKALTYLEQALQSPAEQRAMEAIAQIKHPDAVPLLLRGLNSANFVVRGKAVEALAQIEDPAVIEPLIGLLKKNDFTVQDKVIEALSRHQDPRVDTAFVELLSDPARKDKVLTILRERKWQPQTTRDKVLYYSAQENWDECAKLGPEAADLLLEELKKKPSDGVAKALNRMDEKRAYPVMLDYVKQWQGTPQILAGAEKTGWIPKSAQEQLIVACLKGDKTKLKQLWKEPEGKQEYMNALNSANDSAVYSIVKWSIDLQLVEMVQPMVSQFQRMNTESAQNIVNLFLNSGNETLSTTAANWASANGYQILRFGISGGPTWGS
jgi:HEAT repeat protein